MGTSYNHTKIILVDMQSNKAASEANKRLGMIKRNFRFKSRSVMLPLYKSIMRPHLDYCVQAWRPHYRKEIDKLEKMQRKVTKIVKGLEGYLTNSQHGS